MQFLRKCTVAVGAGLFTFTLFWFVLLMGAFGVIGSSAPVKRAFAESGLYTTGVNDLLAAAQKGQSAQQETQELDLPLSDARIRTIINNAFPPQYLQSNTEKVLDTTYAWLRGDSASLHFTVNLTDPKTRLADGLAAYAKEKAAALPRCQGGALPPSQSFNIFAASCLPPGIDGNQIAEQTKNEIVQGAFLKDTVISPDTLKNDNGQTLKEQLAYAPTVYQRTQQAIYALGVLALLLAAVVIFVSAQRRVGIRRVAITAIIVGALHVMFGWLASTLPGILAANPDMQQPLQQTLIKALQHLTHDVRTWWMSLGLLLVVIGTGTLISLRLTRPKHPAPENTATANSSPSPTVPAEPLPHHTTKKHQDNNPQS